MNLFIIVSSPATHLDKARRVILKRILRK